MKQIKEVKTMKQIINLHYYDNGCKCEFNTTDPHFYVVFNARGRELDLYAGDSNSPFLTVKGDELISFNCSIMPHPESNGNKVIDVTSKAVKEVHIRNFGHSPKIKGSTESFKYVVGKNKVTDITALIKENGEVHLVEIIHSSEDTDVNGNPITANYTYDGEAVTYIEYYKD